MPPDLTSLHFVFLTTINKHIYIYIYIFLFAALDSTVKQCVTTNMPKNGIIDLILFAYAS
jgi:hypothetical protein